MNKREILGLIVTVTLIFTTVGQAGVSVFAQGGDSVVYLPLVMGSQGNIGENARPAAAVDATAITFQLRADVDVNQFMQAYGFEALEAIYALQMYRVRGHDSTVLEQLAVDPRVLYVKKDVAMSTFEAHHRDYSMEEGDFEALKRYFGGSGGDPDGVSPPPNMVIKVKKDQTFDEKWKRWGIEHVKFEKAKKEVTAAGVIVAVLDTGIDLDHPDLVDHLLSGYDFVDSDEVPDDELNGLDDDEDGEIDEGAGHGTHVAGVIGESVPGVKILPVRVLNSDGGGTQFDIAKGLIYATNRGAQVVNMSLSATEDSPLLEAAIRYAIAHQVVIVAAAAGITEQSLGYPAAYDGVLSVGYTNNKNDVIALSTAQQELIMAFAPGEFIYSTYLDGNYAWWSGSSMAAPFVASESALLIGLGACRPSCVIDTITTEVENVKPKPKSKHGMINAEKAVKKYKKGAYQGGCSDADNDGFCDFGDNCVDTPNADQADDDWNGIGNACEAPMPTHTPMPTATPLALETPIPGPTNINTPAPTETPAPSSTTPPPSADGVISGRIWLEQGSLAGIPGVTVNLFDSYGNVVRSSTTSHSGNYLLSNLPPAQYVVRIDVGTLPVGVMPSYDSDGILNHKTPITLWDHQNVPNIDFGYVP